MKQPGKHKPNPVRQFRRRVERMAEKLGDDNPLVMRARTRLGAWDKAHSGASGNTRSAAPESDSDERRKRIPGSGF